MTTSSALTQDKVRVRGPHELIAVVPYLLGFHPEHSAVFVALDFKDTVRLAARLDLPAEGDLDPDGGLPPELAAGIESVFAAIRRSGAASVVVLLFDALAEVALHRAGRARELPVFQPSLVDATVVAARSSDVVVVDVLLVGPQRWRSAWCADLLCCPPMGSQLAAGPTPAQAEAVVAGLTVHRDRESLLGVLEARPDAERIALLPLLQDELLTREHESDTPGIEQRLRRSRVRALFAAARAAEPTSSLASPEHPQPQDIVGFAVSLLDVKIRDSAWIALDEDRIGPELMLLLARSLPAPYDAAPMFLYGWAAWRSGNGVLARAALDRVLASDPEYRAAHMLMAALDGGLDPRQVPRLSSRRRSTTARRVSSTRPTSAVRSASGTRSATAARGRG